MNNVYGRAVGQRPGYSVFDLSYEWKGTADMGELIPICIKEMYPGDRFDIRNEIVVRAEPMVKPPVHPIMVHTAYAFCATQELDDNWVDFWTSDRDWETFP